MQLSEFRDLLANDGFAATFQTMGQYRTELLRALEGLSAQANARPVLWWNGIRKGEAGDFVGPSFSEKEDTNHDIPLVSAVNPCNYTHPEASAPGLSEPAFWISKSDAAWLERVPNVNGQIQALRLGGASRVPVFLTRASAATVGEPSEDAKRLEHIVAIGWEGLRKAWERFGEDHDCETALEELRAVIDADRARPQAAQQQAEPHPSQAHPAFQTVSLPNGPGAPSAQTLDRRIACKPGRPEWKSCQQQAQPSHADSFASKAAYAAAIADAQQAELGADERAEVKLEDLPDWVRNGKCPPTDAELAVMRSGFEEFFKTRGCSDAEFVPHSGGRIPYGRAMTQASWEAWQFLAAQSGQQQAESQIERYCKRCGGEGVIHTGIAEASSTQCTACSGTGLDDQAQPRADERRTFELEVCKQWTPGFECARKSDGTYQEPRVREMRAIWEAALKFVAQSGERSGVAEGWVKASDTVPNVPAGSEREFIIACRRAHNGKTAVFAAMYLNARPLWDDSDDCPETGVPTTGWFMGPVEGDDNSSYERVCDEGDEVTHYMELPAAPTQQQEGQHG